MTEYEYIQKELAQDETHPSVEGIKKILEGKPHSFEDWLVDLVWDLHYEWVELSGVRLLGDAQGEVAPSDA
jgi:hypothetical protein